MPNHLEEEDYQALGRMLAIAGRLEGVVYQIARALAVVEPERQQVGGVITHARRQATESLPPWSSADLVDQERLVAWLDRTKALLERRNRLVHVSWVMQRREEAWVLALVSTRTGEVAPFSRSEVLSLVADAEQVWLDGLTLHNGLLHRLRDDVYLLHPRFRRDTDPRSAGAERPSDGEVEAWYAALSAVAPITWWTWPWPRPV